MVLSVSATQNVPTRLTLRISTLNRLRLRRAPLINILMTPSSSNSAVVLFKYEYWRNTAILQLAQHAVEHAASMKEPATSKYCALRSGGLKTQGKPSRQATAIVRI